MRIPDLTIVVPVHGRQWTLERSLRYLESFEGPVIVADSSDQPYPHIGDFPWVDYRHIPRQPYYEKLKSVFESVQTKFLVDIPDDDFTLLSGLESCCDHMRANPDVTICSGHVLVFRQANGNVTFDLIHTGAHVSTHIAATQRPAGAESVAGRLDRIFGNPVAVTHAVMRRDVALIPHDIIARHPELRPVRFWGKICMFVGAVMGRISYVDAILQVRGQEERLINAPAYPSALEKHVSASEVATRLGDGGGVFTTFLMEQTGLEAAAAQTVVKGVVAHIAANTFSNEAAAKAKAATTLLAEAAIRRQAADLNAVINLIRRYSSASSGDRA